MTTRSLMRIATVVGTLLASAALAESLPSLPRALPLVQGADSPGVVKFDHATHVDTAKPQCATCHPRLFSILGRSAEKRATPVTHARMDKGEACGACHGKQAFGFEDCTMCHAQ